MSLKQFFESSAKGESILARSFVTSWVLSNIINQFVNHLYIRKNIAERNANIFVLGFQTV